MESIEIVANNWKLCVSLSEMPRNWDGSSIRLIHRRRWPEATKSTEMGQGAFLQIRWAKEQKKKRWSKDSGDVRKEDKEHRPGNFLGVCQQLSYELGGHSKLPSREKNWVSPTSYVSITGASWWEVHQQATGHHPPRLAYRLILQRTHPMCPGPISVCLPPERGGDGYLKSEWPSCGQKYFR